MSRFAEFKALRNDHETYQSVFIDCTSVLLCEDSTTIRGAVAVFIGRGGPVVPIQVHGELEEVVERIERVANPAHPPLVDLVRRVVDLEELTR